MCNRCVYTGSFSALGKKLGVKIKEDIFILGVSLKTDYFCIIFFIHSLCSYTCVSCGKKGWESAFQQRLVFPLKMMQTLQQQQKKTVNNYIQASTIIYKSTEVPIVIFYDIADLCQFCTCFIIQLSAQVCIVYTNLCTELLLYNVFVGCHNPVFINCCRFYTSLFAISTISTIISPSMSVIVHWP